MTLQQAISNILADQPNLTDDQLLAAVRDYPVASSKMVSSDVMTILLLNTGLYTVFVDTAADTQHPARALCMAVVDRIRTQGEFNFIAGHPKADAVLALMAGLKQAMPDYKDALDALEAAAIAESNPEKTPFENVTLHEILIARGACPTKAVTAATGYVSITITDECPAHRPRLLVDHPVIGVRRINNFGLIDGPGEYHAEVPAKWISYDLFVDDAYGVI